MSTTLIGPALAQVRAAVGDARLAVARAGTVTWAGTAADAAEGRRRDLLTDLRLCLDALDAADRLVQDARRAEQRCVAGPALVPAGGRTWP